MPNVLLVAYVSQGVALGYGQHLGLQPAPTIYRAFCANWFIFMHLCRALHKRSFSTVLFFDWTLFADYILFVSSPLVSVFSKGIPVTPQLWGNNYKGAKNNYLACRNNYKGEKIIL